MNSRTSRRGRPAVFVSAIVAGAAMLAGMAQAQETGCRTVDQTGWVAEVTSVPQSTTVNFGPHKARQACEVGWQRIESMGEQHCQTNYSDGTLYRNGQLLPVEPSFSDCRCQESADRTVCQISTSVQCSYEVYRTAGTQICN